MPSHRRWSKPYFHRQFQYTQILFAYPHLIATDRHLGQSSFRSPGSSAGSGSVGAPVMILDELDSGVGSRLGQPVAAMLRRMTVPPSGPGAGHGTAAQILCVSHIPQVRD